jgi:putative two-component system response regulator
MQLYKTRSVDTMFTTNSKSTPNPNPKRNTKDMKIVIVEDDSQSVLLESILNRAGFENIYCLPDPRLIRDAVDVEHPDLLLLGSDMPRMSGLEVMQVLSQKLLPGTFFPIVVLSEHCSPETREAVLQAGAEDILTKPLNVSEVTLRVQTSLETRRSYLELSHQKESLERLVQERTHQLEQAHIEMLTRLARISEHRDDQSGEHVWRVAALSAMLARELNCEAKFIDLILRAARLHDLGKTAIPDGVLLKPDKLTGEEFEIIKKHTTLGAQLLTGSGSSLMQMAEQIALTHHERWDGLGYPRGLKGLAIPLEGRIVAVADTFDSMIYDRPYKRAQSVLEAVLEIQNHRGKQYDPEVVDACSRLYERGDLSS